jgi:hypothetical protein
LFLAAGAVALGMALVFVQVSPQVRAGPPPPVTILDAEALRDSGRGLTLASRSIEGVGLVDPIPGGRVKNPRSLAAAPDGLALAVSTVDLGVIGPLTLARADGSQLEIALPGVRGAGRRRPRWRAVEDRSCVGSRDPAGRRSVCGGPGRAP